ncbi:glycoside hydrolase family 3 C-terminal domain-containing protein [Demequina iriomotensis]|uniref:glycoside hydrolase family 3 C-terminal domain-containing protein n=1 Tax=Demequina iriomotensis TaxID=1536641 RepID=UPI0007867C10|nr:glycoside hydrolase family 3 N-terminal domain-containing protein [Demequina iriomotensis]
MTHPAPAPLTLEQKAALLSGADLWHTRAIPEADVPTRTLADGPHGVRLQDASQDHLGIYASAPATAFPTGAALGSTWDPDLVEEVGVALGREARALGVDVLLGPGINIKRSPLCGRNFEYLSEDPFHAGVLGASWVRGVQSQGVGASLKHYAANNQETERLRVSAEVDERTLREIYLPAFERAVTEAAPATVMCSYNKVNGTFASEHHWLLSEVLRDEWGFDGYVVSDWGAVHDPVAALRAGLDLEMPSTGEASPAAIVAAVQAGELDEAVVDRAVARILATHDRLDTQCGEAEVPDLDAHHALARRAAAAGAVLLSNRDGALPLDPIDGGLIAVIGGFATAPRFQGGGSSHVNPTRVDVALDEIRRLTARPVEHAAGFSHDAADGEALADEAVALAARADATVLFLGLPEEDESEGFDRAHLDLPPAQLALLERVAADCDTVIVVLSNGGALALGPVIQHADAVVEMWLGGQASGGAAADLLLGVAEPGGRLAETLPLRLEDTPAFLNFPGDRDGVLYGERVYVGYRWYDTVERAVLAPFGHGLSYTIFELDGLEVEVPDPTATRATVRVTVTNTGDRPGSTVVQLYVSDPVATLDRPASELKGFAKVTLAAGESRRLTFELDERAFQFWSRHGWLAEAGEFVVRVGMSSRDIRAERSIALDLPASLASLTVDSTITEWLAHPQGGVVVQGILGAMAANSGGAGLSEGPGLRMVEQLSLSRLFQLAGRDGKAEVERILAGLTVGAR